MDHDNSYLYFPIKNGWNDLLSVVPTHLAILCVLGNSKYVGQSCRMLTFDCKSQSSYALTKAKPYFRVDDK